MNVSAPQHEPGRSAFTEELSTQHLVAQHTSVPVQGGIRYARIGATFCIDGAQITVQDLESYRGRDIKLVARCIGYRRGPELTACPLGEAEMTGDDGFEALRAMHLGQRLHPKTRKPMTLDDLVKNHECHLFSLFSEDPHDPEAHAAAMARYEENVEQLTKLRKAGRILEANSLLQMLGGEPRKPIDRRVGLVMPTTLSGRFDSR